MPSCGLPNLPGASCIKNRHVGLLIGGGRAVRGLLDREPLHFDAPGLVRVRRYGPPSPAEHLDAVRRRAQARDQHLPGSRRPLLRELHSLTLGATTPRAALRNSSTRVVDVPAHQDGRARPPRALLDTSSSRGSTVNRGRASRFRLEGKRMSFEAAGSSRRARSAAGIVEKRDFWSLTWPCPRSP